MKPKKLSPAELAYTTFCAARNLDPHLPLSRAARAAWAAFAGAAAAGAGTPLAWAAYRAAHRAPAGMEPAPGLRELKDGEIRALRHAVRAVRP